MKIETDELSKSVQACAQKYLDSKITPPVSHVHRASEIGHPCNRYLYYRIHDWEKSQPVSVSLQGIFETGNLLERFVLSHFNDHIGPLHEPKLRIIKTQTATRDKTLEAYGIYGTYDGFLQFFDEESRSFKNLGTVDVKTCSSNLFDRYCDEQSLTRHPWSYKYRAQAMTYAFSENVEYAFLLFVNKQNVYHDWKIVPVAVDYAYMESLLSRVGDVNTALQEQRAPEKLNEPFWCNNCPFSSFCIPELTARGAEMKVNEKEELESLVERMMTLKPLAAEYEELKKTFTDSVIKGQPLAFRNYLLMWQEVAAVRKPSPGGPYSFWKSKLVATNATGETDTDE